MWLIELGIASVPLVVFSFCLFLARNYLSGFIARKVEHGFSAKLETIKSELRRAENETEALRNSLLGEVFGRGKYLYERKVQATERIWKEAIKLSNLRGYSDMTLLFDFDYIKRLDNGEEEFEEFFAKFKDFERETGIASDIELERIFVSNISWSIFSAYRAVVFDAYVRFKMLENRIFDVKKYMNTRRTVELLKQIFPKEVQYIQEQKEHCFPIMLDDLKQLLFEELQAVVAGAQEDDETFQRAQKILEKTRDMSAQMKSD